METRWGDPERGVEGGGAGGGDKEAMGDKLADHIPRDARPNRQGDGAA